MFWQVLALIVVGSVAVITIASSLTIIYDPNNATALGMLKFVGMLGLGLAVLIVAILAFALPTAAYEVDDEEPHDSDPKG